MTIGDSASKMMRFSLNFLLFSLVTCRHEDFRTHRRKSSENAVTDKPYMPDLQIASLPETKQTSLRMLATITIATQARPDTLVRQLDAYVAACEAGFEVHVVLVTYTSWSHNDAGIYQKTRYLCMRLAADMPIVVWKEHENVAYRLSAKHRSVFFQMKDKYDFFLSQEDDYMVLPRHLQYFVKWNNKLKGTDMLPGFAAMEVPTDSFGVADIYREAYTFWHTFTGHAARIVDMFKHNDSILFMHRKAWAAFYIITNDMLKEFVAKPSWFMDEHKAWLEINTHFQHLWLVRYYRMVIPLDDVMDSFIHHSSNKYANILLQEDTEFDLNTTHTHLASTHEFVALLHQCIGNADLPSTVAWNFEDVQYSNAGAHPCKTCLENSMAINMDIKFNGPFATAFKNHTSNASVGVTCLEMNNIPKQELSGCDESKSQSHVDCSTGYKKIKRL